MTQDSIAAQQLEIYLARRFIEQNMCITANQTNGRSLLQGAASLGGQTEDERVGAGGPQIQGSNWQGPGRSSAGGDRRFGRREVGLYPSVACLLGRRILKPAAIGPSVTVSVRV